MKYERRIRYRVYHDGRITMAVDWMTSDNKWKTLLTTVYTSWNAALHVLKVLQADSAYNVCVEVRHQGINPDGFRGE